MAGLDALLGASVEAVKRSGAIENSALMGSVSVVNTNGTVDVVRADDTYPSVRLLTSYLVPTVGDRVEIIKTAGGWVCVGVLATVTPTPQWVSVTPATGFTNNGNSNGNLQYRVINSFGSPFAQWSGGVSWATSGTPANSGVICTVPAAARPAIKRSLAAGAGSDVVKIDFNTDGTVSIVQRGTSTLTTWCSLNGLMYRLD